ncbi:MAG: glutathione peroxidase [Candidatus Rifleibacteriota bacterium]
MTKSIFEFEAVNLQGETISFSCYRGKVVLLVNIASRCGFTPQLGQLQKLYEKYQKDGLVILGFPCNQFANQEPLSNSEISEFCKLNYGVTFPVFAKTDVNGDNAHPVFKFAKESLPGLLGNFIKWNFTKFLFDKNGTGYKRYAPTTSPVEIEKDIVLLLQKNA